MNEELLRLAYSKLNTEASFEDFKSDFEGDENLQKLVYGKLNTEASFEDFMIDVRGTEVKKKGVSEPTATEPQSDSVTPQEVQDTSSATTQPMETQASASSNGEVEPPATNVDPLSSLSSEEVLKLQDRAQKQLSEEYKESGSKEDFSLTPEQINERALELYEVDKDLVKFEESSWIDDTWNKMKSATASAVEGLASIPAMRNDVLFTLLADDEMKESLNKLDVDQRRRVLNKAFAINDLEEKGFDLSFDIADEAREVSKKIQSQTTQFDRGIIDDIRDGNYYKAGSRIASEGVGSIPSIAQAMIPYVGIGSIVMGSAAKKNDELQREGEDLNYKTLLNSSINGAAEGLLEITTKKLGGKMWDALGGDIAVEQGKSIIRGFVENLILDPLKEGASEGGTSLIQNLSDLYVQGKEKEFKEIFEEAAEASLVGIFSGKAMGGITTAAQTTTRLKQSIDIDKIVDSGTNEFTSVKDAFSPENKKDILDKLRIASYSTSSQKLDKDLKKAQNKGEITEEQAEEYRSELSKVQGQLNKTKNLGLSDEARVEAVELVDKKESLKKEIEGLDDALASPKKEEIAKIDERLTELATNKNKKENNEKEQPGTQNETTNQEGNEGTETTSTDTEQETGETEVQEEVETTEEDDVDFSDLDFSEIEANIGESDSQGTISDNLDRKVYKDGKVYNLRLHPEEKKTVILENETDVIDLGNIDEIGDNFVMDEGMTIFSEEGVDVQETSSDKDVVDIDGESFEFLRKSRDKKGQTVITVKDSKGLTRKLKGAKADLVLKDMALRDGKKSPKPIKLNVEGRESKKDIENKKKEEAREKAKKRREKEEEAFLNKTADEIAKLEKKYEKENNELADIVLKDAQKQERKTKRNVVEFNGKIYEVQEKETKSKEKGSEGKKIKTHVVRTMNNKGEVVPIRDKKLKDLIISESNKERKRDNNKILEEGQREIEKSKKEQKDKINEMLDNAINYLKEQRKGKLYSSPLGVTNFIAESALVTVKAAYNGGKSLTEAIKAGYNYAKNKGYKGSEVKFNKWAVSELKKPKKQPKPTVKPTPKATTKPKSNKNNSKTRGEKVKIAKQMIKDAFEGKKLNFSAAKMKSMVNQAIALDPNNDLKTEKFVEKVKEVIAKEEAKASDAGTTKKSKEIRNSVKNGELGKVDKGNKSKINRFARLNLKDVPDSVKKKYKDAIDNIHKLTSKSKESSKKVDFDAVSKDIDEVLGKTKEYLANKASVQSQIDIFIDSLSNAEKKEISESKETNIKVVTDKMNLTADERQFIEDNKGSVSAYLKDSDVEVEFDGNETKKSIEDSWKSDDKKTWNKREREIIRSLKDFTAIQFAALSNKEKKKLNESIQKLVESGIVDANLQDIVNKLEGDSFFDRVEGAIPNLSVGWNNLIKGISRAIENVGGDKNITMASKKANSNKIIKIDSSLKNYENNVIYKTIFAPFAKASSIYENYMNDVNARFSNFSERFKSDNDKVRVGQKATIYMVDLYRKTNPQLNIASVKSYLEDTIEKAEPSKVSKRTRNSLKELLKDLDFDADGNLTQKSIDKLLAEDNVKSSVDFLRKELDDNREDAYSSSLFDTKNGVGFNENYFPLVSSATRAAEDLGDMFKGGKPSVTSNNLKQLSGKPDGKNIIDFDAFNTAFRSINTTQKQDKMHRPHQVAKVVFDKLRDKYNSGSQEMEMVEAIEDLYYTQIERATGSVNVGDRGLLDDVKKVALTWTYRKLLGSTEKFVVDAASNVIAANAMVGVTNFIKGDKIRTKINRITKEGDSPTLLGDVLSTLGCTQIDRFTSLRLNSNGKVELDLEGLRGRFRKSNLDPKWKESMQLLLNKSVVAGRSSKDISKTPGYLADQMIGQPDIMSGLPLWFGAFTKEFENISGKELDIDKVINKDQDYIDSIYKDIEKASNYANIKLDEFASTKNKIERKPSMHNKNIGVQAIQGSKNFMLGQTESEWTTLKKYFGNLMHNKVEGLTKKESLKVATAISARLLLYRPLMNMAKASKTVVSLGAASFALGLTGEDDLDEELDESVDYLSEMFERQNLAKSAVSSATDLATTAVTGIGGSYKNKAVNWTADWLYEQIKEDFDPEGNYDPDTFNKIPIKVKDLNSRTLALNAADIIVGQYAPSINSLISGKPSEILPFTGAIPLAGDISNLVKTMNKSIGKESTALQRIYGWSLWNAMKESAKGDPTLLRKRNNEAKKMLEDSGIDEDIINEIRNEIEGIKDEIDADDLRDSFNN